MICLGLTGSIGMGKTTVAGMFGALGAAVWDADAAVHRLYAPGAKGAAVIALLVPAAVGADGVDRGQLRTAIMEDADLLARIEARIHPLVSQDRAQFANDMRARGTQVAVFDIPLLFETQAERTLDKTVVVSAPAEMQRARVMARPGMTEAIFSRILAKQMPDEEKRRRADYVIHTDGEKAQTMLQVQAVWADVIENAMREIAMDTETTGLDALHGDRIVEIGAVELINHVPTGRSYHQYINPERPMPREAFEVHGLGDDFLQDKPVFAAIADAFVEFIGDATLVIHNAPFDMGFLNAEFARIGKPRLPDSRAIDTVAMARKRYPGAQASLDALCRRFNIDNSRREKHGALLDSELLAEVYLELLGGRQQGLSLVQTLQETGRGPIDGAGRTDFSATRRPQALPPRLSAQERTAHAEFIAELGKDALWHRENG